MSVNHFERNKKRFTTKVSKFKSMERWKQNKLQRHIFKGTESGKIKYLNF